MQTFQRTRHHIFWGMLALIIPVFFLIALLGRKPIPTTETLPVPRETEETRN